MKEDRILAWHFLPDSGIPQWNYKRRCYVGQTLVAKGQLELCSNGLHGSRRALDALAYAPGNVACRVELWGDVIEDDDKLVARRRRIVGMADAGDELRSFARWCALQVIHLWDAPEVVRQYLESGDESLREAAWAAWAAWAAAKAAGEAAWAAWAAAKAAGEAAWAAGEAAWAAWAAAGEAAWAAGEAAKAAGEAAWDEYNAELEQRLLARMGDS